MKTYAIIPAGGSGSRTGAAVPKQFIKINGRELIAITLDVFNSSDIIDEIIISTKKEYFETIRDLKASYGFSKISGIVEGGSERQHSVYNGLKSLNCEPDDLIVVHDAARPLLPPNVLSNAVNLAKEKKAVVVAIKAKDTIFRGDESVKEFVDRAGLFYAQTPQIFRYDILMNSFMRANQSGLTFTDESSIVLNAGYEVHISEGSAFNFKVTTADDINFIKSLKR